jgi:hypothetical protein
MMKQATAQRTATVIAVHDIRGKPCDNVLERCTILAHSAYQVDSRLKACPHPTHSHKSKPSIVKTRASNIHMRGGKP